LELAYLLLKGVLSIPAMSKFETFNRLAAVLGMSFGFYNAPLSEFITPPQNEPINEPIKNIDITPTKFQTIEEFYNEGGQFLGDTYGAPCVVMNRIITTDQNLYLQQIITGVIMPENLILSSPLPKLDIYLPKDFPHTDESQLVGCALHLAITNEHKKELKLRIKFLPTTPNAESPEYILDFGFPILYGEIII
jgi:hypothetical protein